MKTFEHKVLSFKTGTKKQLEEMQEQLSAWGAAGFELVAVTEAPPNFGGGVTAYLKRGTPESHSDLASEDAA